MPLYEINLLGPPIICVDGNKISLSRNKSVALIAYLACTGRHVGREELASLFWPDSTNSHGLAALRTVLADIKSKLGSDLLIVDRNIIYLSLVNVKCDVNIFIKGIPISDNITKMEKTANLWRGGFLKGFSLNKCAQFNDWLFLEDQNLLREYHTLIERISLNFADNNNFKNALFYAHKLLVLDFFNEESHRKVMELYASMGDKKTALKQYNACVETLETELGFPPEEETQALAEKIRKGNFKRKTTNNLLETSGKSSNLPRMAVLPFVIRNNIKKDSLNLYDIVSEAITDIFSSNSRLEVISRTSTLSYKNTTKNLPRIAAELRVDYIIEGFIEVLQDNVLLEGRLIDASHDTVIAIKREEGKPNPETLISRGTSIAANFLNELGLIKKQNLSQNQEYKNKHDHRDPGRPWRLHAKHLLRDYNPQNIEQAMKLYNKAVELNTVDAKAWAGLAFANLIRGASGYFEADIELIYKQAEESVTKALSIEPDQATALWIRGQITAKRDWDYESAERYYKRAIKSDPGNSEIYASYSQNLNFQGKYKEALAMAEKACQLDPVNNLNFSAKYWSLISLKMYRKASEFHESVEKFFPNPAWHYFSRGFIQILLGDYKKAIKIIEPIQNDLIAQNMFTFLGMLAYAYAAAGSTDKAENLITDLSKNRESLIGLHMPLAASYTVMNKRLKPWTVWKKQQIPKILDFFSLQQHHSINLYIIIHDSLRSLTG